MCIRDRIKAYDGFEALELLQTHTVNLMIIDVMMPGLDLSLIHISLPLRITHSKIKRTNIDCLPCKEKVNGIVCPMRT